MLALASAPVPGWGTSVTATRKIPQNLHHSPAGFTTRIQQEKTVADPEEILDREAQMSEFFFLGLRRTKGVSLTEFQRLFEVSAFEIYGQQIRRLMEYGLLKQQGARLFLTEYGLDVSNMVFCEFV